MPNRRPPPLARRATWPANGDGTRRRAEGLELTLSLGDHGFRKRAGLAHRNDAPLPLSCRAPRPAEWRRETPDSPQPDRRKICSAAPTVRSTNKIWTRSACRPARPARSLPVLSPRLLTGRSTAPSACSQNPARCRAHSRMPASSFPTLEIITRTLIEQNKTIVKANAAFPSRYSRLPQRPRRATGPSRPLPH